MCRPNPGVAALLVRSGTITARGITQPGGRPHAEAQALAGLGPAGAKGATLYVTLEPCAHVSQRGEPCAQLLTQTRPDRVVIGQRDPDPRTAGRGIARLEEAGIEVTVLDDPACARSLKGYLTRQRLTRPHVTLKLAQSLDGCIALANGSSQWITGPEARAHCHAMRARCDAILVGRATWRRDRPRLDVRLPGLADRSPDRVLLTRGVQPDGVSIINTPEEIAGLEGVDALYVEGGAQTAASFLAADLVDELHLYRAPILIGDGLRSLRSLGIESLADAHGRWRPDRTARLGSDSFASYLRER